jgi:hypothetical protein
MPVTTKPVKDFYTEAEAAAALGITLPRLQGLLDQNLFNDGTPRPLELSLRPSDLVLISFWNKTSPNPKVVRMPRRS